MKYEFSKISQITYELNNIEAGIRLSYTKTEPLHTAIISFPYYTIQAKVEGSKISITQKIQSGAYDKATVLLLYQMIEYLHLHHGYRNPDHPILCQSLNLSHAKLDVIDFTDSLYFSAVCHITEEIKYAGEEPTIKYVYDHL